MKNWFLLPTVMLFAGLVHAADMPSQGMSMAKVQQHFGAPARKLGPVGKPPITRWVYPDYTVVFERRHVVQSVRMVQESAAPAPATVPAATPVAPGEATINVEVKP